MYSFGIDIGGMSIKIGLVDKNGKIVEKRVIKTVSDQNLAIKNMAEQIQDILKTQNITIKDIKGIGLGCPGAVDGSSGIIDVLPNLGWENVPIVAKLNEYFDVKVEKWTTCYEKARGFNILSDLYEDIEENFSDVILED